MHAHVVFCRLKTSSDYQLKPVRGMKTQTAFVVIADVLEAGSAEKASRACGGIVGENA